MPAKKKTTSPKTGSISKENNELTTIIKNGFGFATYPSVKLMGDKLNAKKEKTFGLLKELLFGDYIKPYLKNGKLETRSEKGKEYIKVRCRNKDGYITLNQIQANRILEVNFVDVGQGDGCHVVTPDDEHLIIDAGPADNMYRFLKWRFNLGKAKNAPPPFKVVISHSDSDHYKGFQKIFAPTAGSKNQFSIPNVYHNGLIETSGTKVDGLGKVTEYNGDSYIETVLTDSAAKKIIVQAGKGDTYLKTLGAAPKAKIEGLVKKKVSDKVLLPVKSKGGLEIEVMGPVAVQSGGKSLLPVFDDNKGKTKNGHSVILVLRYGHMKLLLGGDLNHFAEDYILSFYSGVDVAGVKKQLASNKLAAAKRTALQKELDSAILEARKYLEVDVAKSCHHGSGDFTSEFLRALNASATVISSGDDEPHCHPRPNTLGSIGKHSYGEQSLIFCTELARSGKEFIDITKLKGDKKKVRVVTVYGMINVRTDGQKAIIAQKLERPAPRGNWDIHCLEYSTDTGKFEYVM